MRLFHHSALPVRIYLLRPACSRCRPRMFIRSKILVLPSTVIPADWFLVRMYLPSASAITIFLKFLLSRKVPGFGLILWTDLTRSNVYPITTSPGLGSSINPLYTGSNQSTPTTAEVESQVRVLESRPKPQCWDHGCNGREFSTFSNLYRHKRERSGAAIKPQCSHCGAVFTRKTARNKHMSNCHGTWDSTKQDHTG